MSAAKSSPLLPYGELLVAVIRADINHLPFPTPSLPQLMFLAADVCWYNLWWLILSFYATDISATICSFCCSGYWKMLQKYIGSDVTSMVTLPVLIFEPMTMLQKMAELMEYSHLLDQADECEDPYLWLVYASSWAISVYYAYQRTWKPFNPTLGETYEMVNHGGMTFIAEQVSHHPPMSARHAENEHFTCDVTSKLKTKFLGNSLDVYPVGRASRYEVDGYIYNVAEEPKILMTGKWNESMSYQPCDMEGEPLSGTVGRTSDVF